MKFFLSPNKSYYLGYEKRGLAVTSVQAQVINTSSAFRKL